MKLLSAIKAASLALWLGVVLAPSLFIGLMIATAGGAIYTPLYRVAAPFACDGELAVESRRYSYKPGQSGVSHTIYCRDAATGERADITFYAIFVASLIYSGLTFLVLLVLSAPLIIPARALARRLKAAGPFNIPRPTWSTPGTTTRHGATSPGTTPHAPGATSPAPGATSPAPGATPPAPFAAARVVFDGREYANPEEMPPEARAAYERAANVLRDSDGDGVPDFFEGANAGAQPPGGDTAARLIKLKSLLDAGLVTPQEYETKKAQILSEL